MPLKVTYEERIEDALRIAKTSRASPGETFVRIMRALDHDFGDGEQVDALWSNYYASQALAEIAWLNAEVLELRRRLAEQVKP